MSKHTPGPWKVEICGDDRCGWPQIIGANGDEVVCSHRMMSERISDEDAALIASAPEMADRILALEALNAELVGALRKCEVALTSYYTADAKADGDALMSARAAIAEGEK